EIYIATSRSSILEEYLVVIGRAVGILAVVAAALDVLGVVHLDGAAALDRAEDLSGIRTIQRITHILVRGVDVILVDRQSRLRGVDPHLLFHSLGVSIHLHPVLVVLYRVAQGLRLALVLLPLGIENLVTALVGANAGHLLGKLRIAVPALEGI